MKKRTKIILATLVATVIGGSIYMINEKDSFNNLFGRKIDLRTTQEKQLDYLKKHEKEMIVFVKNLNSKVESVQFDWDSIEVGEIGNGTPQGGGYMMTIDGKINNNKDTNFTLGIPLNRNPKKMPEDFEIYEMQPIRILRDGGWFLYDY